MVRVFNAYFPVRTLWLAAAELVLVFLALLAAMFMRFGNDTELVLWYQSGFLKIGVVCLVCTAALYYWDLYDSVIISNPREVLMRLVQVLGVVSLALAFLYYIYPPMQLGRGILFIAITLLGIVLVASREAFFAFNRSALFAAGLGSCALKASAACWAALRSLSFNWVASASDRFFDSASPCAAAIRYHL